VSGDGGAGAARLGVRLAVGATVAVAAIVAGEVARVPVIVRYGPLGVGVASAVALVGVVCGMIARNLVARGGAGAAADAGVTRAARVAVRLGVATAVSPLVIGAAFLAWMVAQRGR